MSFPVPLPSTFMPLPLAIMIPFMGIQSGVMAQQFGMNFQFGKRKISAMSNEEFNKLTPAQLQADMNEQIKLLIPTFGEALREMRPFQRMIFEEMLAVMKTAIDVGIDVAKAGVDPLAHIFGQHIHGSTVGDQDPDKFKPPDGITPFQPSAEVVFGSPKPVVPGTPTPPKFVDTGIKYTLKFDYLRLDGTLHRNYITSKRISVHADFLRQIRKLA